MTDALLYGYLGGWMLTSALAMLTASRERRPQWLSVLAGAVWPVLAVAVAQMVLIAFTATILRSTSGDSAVATALASHEGSAFVKTV